MKILILIILISLSTSCASRKMDKIKVIHFTDDFHAKTNLGVVQEKKCKYQAGEYEAGESLSYDKAYADLISQKGGLSYIENLERSEDNQHVTDLKGNTIAGKKCIVVKGIGYK